MVSVSEVAGVVILMVTLLLNIDHIFILRIHTMDPSSEQICGFSPWVLWMFILTKTKKKDLILGLNGDRFHVLSIVEEVLQ